MRKSTITSLAILCVFFTKAQIGIGTPTPQATVDISAKQKTGTSNEVDGLLIPRVDRQRAQSMLAPQVSTLIYVNSIATGTQTGKAINIDKVGYYYFDGTTWVTLNSSTSTPITGENLYTTDGTLNSTRTVALGANKLAFTGTSANAFSIDGTTFSVNAANNRVGIGTISPSQALDVNGNTRIRSIYYNQSYSGSDKVVVADPAGNLRTTTIQQSTIPKVAVFSLPTTQNNFLNNQGVGGANVVPMTQVYNGIDGLSYNPSLSHLTIPTGVYQMVFSYEGTIVSEECSLSSYFIDFPTTSGANQRIHSTANHNSGGNSNHGGNIVFTARIDQPRVWAIHLGRGISGNCINGLQLVGKSTQFTITRLSDI